MAIFLLRCQAPEWCSIHCTEFIRCEPLQGSHDALDLLFLQFWIERDVGDQIRYRSCYIQCLHPARQPPGPIRSLIGDQGVGLGYLNACCSQAALELLSYLSGRRPRGIVEEHVLSAWSCDRSLYDRVDQRRAIAGRAGATTPVPGV